MSPTITSQYATLSPTKYPTISPTNNPSTAPSMTPMRMTERYSTPYKLREKLVEFIFENLSISSLYLRDSSSLSIYGTGRTKGIVLDIGHNITSIITIDGHINDHTHQRGNEQSNDCNKIIEFGGYDITTDLQKEYGISSYFHSNKIKEVIYYLMHLDFFQTLLCVCVHVKIYLLCVLLYQNYHHHRLVWMSLNISLHNALKLMKLGKIEQNCTMNRL